MEDDVVLPGPAADGAEGDEGDEKDIDPDVLEDTFDDIDPL